LQLTLTALCSLSTGKLDNFSRFHTNAKVAAQHPVLTQSSRRLHRLLDVRNKA